MPSSKKRCKGTGFKLIYSPPSKKDSIIKVLPGKVGTFIVEPVFTETSQTTEVVFILHKHVVFRGSDSFKADNIIPEIFSISEGSAAYKELIYRYSSRIPENHTNLRMNELKTYNIFPKETQSYPKTLELRCKYFYLTYPKIIPDLPNLLAYIRNKLKKEDPKIEIINYSLVNEVSFILLHPHCHVMFIINNTTRIRDPRFFDLEDGTHPNIIAHTNHSEDILKKTFFYHYKSRTIPYHSITPDQEKEWIEESKHNQEILLKTYSLNALMVRMACEEYEKDPSKAESLMSPRQIKELLREKDKLLRVPKINKDPVTNNSLKKIIEWNETYKSKILIYIDPDIKNTSSFINHLFENHPNICKTHRVKAIPDSIYEFNKTNVSPRVSTILLHNIDIHQDNLFEYSRRIEAEDLMLEKIKTSQNLEYSPDLNIIIFLNEPPRLLRQLHPELINKIFFLTSPNYKFVYKKLEEYTRFSEFSLEPLIKMYQDKKNPHTRNGKFVFTMI